MVLKQYAKKLMKQFSSRANYKFVLKDWVSLKDLNFLSKVLESKRFSHNLEPVAMSCPDGKRILVISPHPDDDVLSSGGTILKSIRNSSIVKILYLTSGKGLKDKPSRIEEESIKVSERSGTSVEFWRYPLNKISIDEEAKNKVVNSCSEFKPGAVFLPFLADDHDDHRRAAQLFYESFKNLKRLDFEVWAYQIYSTLIPNVVVDITDVMEEKLRLIGLWESIKNSRDWAHYIKGLNAFNCRFLKTNEPRYAETFFVVPAREYIDLCGLYFEHPKKDIYYSDFYQKG